MHINFQKEINHDEIGVWVKNKRTNVLILRFIASLFVIGVHLRFILNIGYSSNSIAYSIVECITAIGVNVFIICTTISSFMKQKNNWKHFGILVAILYIYFWVQQIINTTSGSNVDYLAIFLPIFAPGLWYLRAYVVFYPLIPIINKGLRDFKLAFTFIIFYLIFTISQSFVIREFNISEGYHLLHFIFLYMFTRSLMIVFFDYFKKKKTILLISGITYILLLIVNVITTYYVKSNVKYSDYPMLLLATSFSTFFMFIDFKPNIFNKSIAFLGKQSLYFYILDSWIWCFDDLSNVMRSWYPNLIVDYISSFLMKVLTIITIVLLVYGMIYLIKKLIQKSKLNKPEKKN